ncbi:septum formation initiator family protein [Nocardioides sp. Arc9.136]|uniref:FtsB family cell division protein n=1 Tax=Nocardioides sp. Arc9.136 TaxID=2996826 RepID=UPI00266697FF|nr:septum formation initiator family protein [Nocardioides sp. Arc9.136]WKN49417.1 septum formation initiator family protein [Nocardioides sp. Arc9.136]
MADDRRDPRGARRPRGRTGPGRPSAGAAAGAARGTRPGRPDDAPARRRPRLTGRAAVLVLVLAVLAVSYASSMRAFLHQRGEIAELKAQIAERKAAIDDLEREKKRWQDPAFVQSRARAELGYVLPGETPFVVLQDDEPLTTGARLSDPDDLPEQAPEAWWVGAWESVELAGHPPKDGAPPAAEIDGSAEENEETE